MPLSPSCSPSALLAWAIVLWQRGAGERPATSCWSARSGFTMLHATRDLAVALVEVTQHMARLSEAIATLLQPHELQDHPEAEPLAGRGTSVDVRERVASPIPAAARCSSDFSLRFAAGQRTGLVGPSGGGKSTLLALMQRFHDVERGRILIDGQDIARTTQDSLRQAISFVPQDISLLHRSVLENIRYGRPDAIDAEVRSGRRGGALPRLHRGAAAGFRHRSSASAARGCRAASGSASPSPARLLKDSPILLLDEATSSLDGESEEAIRQALDRLMQGRTVIAIAHRLSTLRSFDRIVVLHQRPHRPGRPARRTAAPRRPLSRAGRTRNGAPRPGGLRGNRHEAATARATTGPDVLGVPIMA